jgi:hypothetical protein
MRHLANLATNQVGSGPVSILHCIEVTLLIMHAAAAGGFIDLAKQLPGKGFVSGKLRCPMARVVCPELSCKRPCGHGVCNNGRCICDMEYVGENCDKSLIPGVL